MKLSIISRCQNISYFGLGGSLSNIPFINLHTHCILSVEIILEKALLALLTVPKFPPFVLILIKKGQSELKGIKWFFSVDTAWKVPKYGVVSGTYFPVFSPNTGKYGPEITPYLDTFHAVRICTIVPGVFYIWLV